MFVKYEYAVDFVVLKSAELAWQQRRAQPEPGRGKALSRPVTHVAVRGHDGR